MTMHRLTSAEVKVLAVLASSSEDFGYWSFKRIGRYARLRRTIIRRACRSLTRKGLAQYGRGLWFESGGPAGSGYAVTTEGRSAADPALTDRIALRRWE